MFATRKVDCKQILCDDGDDWPLSANAKSDSVDSVNVDEGNNSWGWWWVGIDDEGGGWCGW